MLELVPAESTASQQSRGQDVRRVLEPLQEGVRHRGEAGADTTEAAVAER